MIPLWVIATACATLACLLLGSAAMRQPRRPDVRFDPKDPDFHRMVARIERRDSGGMGRID